jgi:hypothetical protein
MPGLFYRNQGVEKIHAYAQYHYNRQKQVNISEVLGYAAQYGYGQGTANVS